MKTSKGGSLTSLLRIHRVILYNAALIIILFIVWEAIAKIFQSRFFPSFTDVTEAAVRVITVGDVEGIKLHEHAVASILRVLAGFVLACITGISLGLMMGLRRQTYDASKSIIESVRFIPPIAWIPLVYILLSGYSRYILIIWLGAFFPILLNTIAGIKRTSPILVDVAKSFGADNKSTVSKVVIPSALPETVAGVRIGLGIGWMCIVAAEMIGGEMIGLGRLIMKAAELLQTDVVIVGMVTIGLIGLLMNETFLRFEKRFFRWRVEVKM